MASLFVIQGADQGKRFEFKTSPVPLGRDNSNAIRLHDTEVSRRHAEIRPRRRGVPDRRPRLGERHVRQRPARRPGPVAAPATGSSSARRSCSSTTAPLGAERDLTDRVDLLEQEQPRGPLGDPPEHPGRRRLAGACSSPTARPAGSSDRLANLSVMYQATQAISHILDLDSLLPQILQLVFESIGADRGAILLNDGGGRTRSQGRPLARAGRRTRRADDDLADDHRPRAEQGPGGHHDRRPGRQAVRPRRSRSSTIGIREAICVPVQGRHTTLGVLYADVQSDGGLALEPPRESQDAGAGSPRST